MRSPSVRQVLIVWPFALFLTGCSLSALPIRPPEPETLPPVQSPAFPVVDSVITLPVRADLTPVLNAANDEGNIPKTFDHWGSYIKGARGVGYKYYAERDEFTMTPSGAGFSPRAMDSALLRDWWKGVNRGANVPLSVALRYKIGAHGDLSSGGAPARCGDGGQWPSRGMLNGDIGIDLTPNYEMTASITNVAFNPIDPCVIDIPDIDVTKAVHGKLEEVMRGGLKNVLARVNTVTFKSHMEEAWDALRRPIQLTPDMWLLFNVEQIGHAGFSGQGPVIENTIQLGAKPRIVHGNEPDPSSSALPQLGAQLHSDRFRIVVDTQLGYAELSQALVARLRGKRIVNEGDTVVIVDASISGNGGNQVVVRVDFRGDARGHVYLVGKPQLNLLTQTIYISDLRYDHESGSRLKKSAEWLYNSRLRQFLSSETVFGVTAATKKVQSLLAPALMRRMSQTVTMDGRMTSVQGIGVFADSDALSVRSIAEGTLSLTISNGS